MDLPRTPEEPCLALLYRAELGNTVALSRKIHQGGASTAASATTRASAAFGNQPRQNIQPGPRRRYQGARSCPTSHVDYDPQR